MPAPAKDAANAGQEWLKAQKTRRSVQHEVDRVKKSVGDGSEVDHFKKLEELIAKYRLQCVATLWLDIELGSKEKVENALWTTHVLLNSAYRKVREKLKENSKEKSRKSQYAVTRRNIDELYENFLKVTQGFYKGYLQRLCARYRDLPELQRLVHGGIVDRMNDVDEEKRVDAVANGIDKQVLASCHLTLIYLGDLWRYRVQLRQPERRNFDTALAFYRLANDLDPRSGYGYHQMGVIFLEQERHFDIVYHFYRSLAAEQPHPNAAKNLEYEFRKVLETAMSPRGQEAHRALQNWFIRLHAHFYGGREFPQHAEMEKEVLHRFGLAVKAHDFVDGLLKTILINICAYQVAKDKITAEWTPERSQFCQFTLRLNIKTICVILGHLEPELTSLVNHMQESSSQQNGTGQTVSTKVDSKFNDLVSSALPLLRVYMTWLCMYRADIIKFESHLLPYVADMYKSLSQVLSSLFEVVGHYPRKVPVPYLFQEDIEAFGLKALNGSTVPTACLLQIDSLTRAPKSRPEEADSQDFKPDDLSFTRALDITTCGVVLADDVALPLLISYAPDGLHLAKVTYLPEGKAVSQADMASGAGMSYTSPSTAAVALSAVLGVRPSPTAATPSLAPYPAVSTTSTTSNLSGVANGFSEALAVPREQKGPLAPIGPAVLSYAPQLAEESNYAVDHDSRMKDLVNGLVEASEFDPPEATSGGDETSYGMHTDTARDVFASAVPSTSPGRTPNRSAFPSLPWSWDSVAQPTSHQRGVSSGSPKNPWPGALSSPQLATNLGSTSAIPLFGLTNLDNPFSSGSSAQYGNGYQKVAEPAASGVQATWQQSWQYGSGNQATATGAGLPSQSFYASAANTNNPWSQGSSKFSSIQDILGAQLGALVPGPRPLGSTPAPPTPAVPSSFASTTFSSNMSSLPPVNSPWGVPTRSAGGSGNFGSVSRPTPPGLNLTSRPNSNGNGAVGTSSGLDADPTVTYRPAGGKAGSRPGSGPATPGLGLGADAASRNGANGRIPQRGQSQNAASGYEAMLQKPRDKTKPS